MPVEPRWTDRRIENILGNLLRAGVGLAAFIVLCGAVLYLARYGFAPADYRVFKGEPSDLRSVGGHRPQRFEVQWPRRHPTGTTVPDRYPRGACHIFDLGICRRARPHVRGLHRDRAGYSYFQPGGIVRGVTLGSRVRYLLRS